MSSVRLQHFVALNEERRGGVRAHTKLESPATGEDAQLAGCRAEYVGAVCRAKAENDWRIAGERCK